MIKVTYRNITTTMEYEHWDHSYHGMGKDKSKRHFVQFSGETPSKAIDNFKRGVDIVLKNVGKEGKCNDRATHREVKR